MVAEELQVEHRVIDAALPPDEQRQHDKSAEEHAHGQRRPKAGVLALGQRVENRHQRAAQECRADIVEALLGAFGIVGQDIVRQDECQDAERNIDIKYRPPAQCCNDEAAEDRAGCHTGGDDGTVVAQGTTAFGRREGLYEQCDAHRLHHRSADGLEDAEPNQRGQVPSESTQRRGGRK